VALPPKFDALDPAVLQDPYPTYAELRAAGPLCRGGPGTWMVTRYAEVTRLFEHPALANRLPAEESGGRSIFGAGPAGELAGRMLSGLEPPEHTVVRRLLGSALGPRPARALRPAVAACADELVDAALERGGFDAVDDLAFPLQAAVVSRLLDLSREDRAEVWPAALELGRAFIPYRIPEPGQLRLADDVTARLRGRLRGLLARRRDHPGDDLVSGLAAEVERGNLTAELAVDNLVFLCFAGFETTMNVIGTMCALLPRHPDQWDRLRAEPDLVPTAVDEFLRYDSPAQYTVRLTRDVLEVGDRTIRPGRMVLLMMGSANRDERQFRDPDRLDLARHPNPHVSFGGGHHHCVGWAVGRSVCEVLLDRLRARVRDLEPGGEPVRLPHPNFRAFRSVPVLAGPA
jgi:cytochrome P450